MTTTLSNKTDAAMGEIIRLHRKAAGMSQADLGRSAGISFQQIQKYEAGQNRVSVHRLFGLADALGQEPAELMQQLQNSVGWATSSGRGADEKELRFLASSSGRRLVALMADLDCDDMARAMADLAASMRARRSSGGA
ncbi:MAG: helix-turn-helix transcriptional regulator [Pseudomonadota bacterium]